MPTCRSHHTSTKVSKCRALTTGICLRAPRGGKGEVQTQASRRGASLRNLRAQRCAAPARSSRYAGLPNS
eukprot:6068104-Pleurochrysis_carterae.AAC.1